MLDIILQLASYWSNPEYLSCDWRRGCGEGGLLTDHGGEQGQAGRDQPQAGGLLLKLLRRAGITFLRCSATAAVGIQSLKHMNNKYAQNLDYFKNLTTIWHMLSSCLSV